MIQILTKLLTDSRGSASISIASAAVGEFATNPRVQAIAIIIAMLAGLFAVINSIDSMCMRHKRNKKEVQNDSVL